MVLTSEEFHKDIKQSLNNFDNKLDDFQRKQDKTFDHLLSLIDSLENLCKEKYNQKEKSHGNIDEEIHETNCDTNRTVETTEIIDKNLQLESDISCVKCLEESADYVNNFIVVLVKINVTVKINSKWIKKFMWFNNKQMIKLKDIDIRQIKWSKNYLDFINCKMKL